jgi:hypothetical protein
MPSFPRSGVQSDDPFADPLDAVLAQIAVNIQLPPGLHAKAVDRYEAVRRYIERPGSRLAGRVTCFYPQGSMRIDATISTRGTDDEYDIDIVAEIEGRDDGPEALLDDLEAAVVGYPVQKIVRQTRCVTLYYADGMHLDVTPARRTALKEKQSVIAHAKKETGADPARYVAMNAFAFGDWYTARTPTEERFAKALNERLYAQAGIAFADADVHDVPEQTPLIIKSVTTVALQLLKRNRNIIYANETGGCLRRSCCPAMPATPRSLGWVWRTCSSAKRAGRRARSTTPLSMAGFCRFPIRSIPPSCSPTGGPKARRSRTTIPGTSTRWPTASRRRVRATSNSKTFSCGCVAGSASGSSLGRFRTSTTVWGGK